MLSTWPSTKPLLLRALWRSWGPHQLGLFPMTQSGQSPVRGSPSIQAPNLGGEAGVTARFFLGSGRVPESVMNTVLAGFLTRVSAAWWYGTYRLNSPQSLWLTA